MEKSLTMPKKLKGWTLWEFSTSILSQNVKKLKGDPFGKIFFPEKKSHNAEKTERGDPLVSPGMVCYAGKQEKAFWFSSLGQIVQFGAKIFCRTILVSSGGLKKTLTKSHDYTRLFSKEKRRLKKYASQKEAFLKTFLPRSCNVL